MILAKKNKHPANTLWIILLPLAIFCALGLFFAFERTGVGLGGKLSSTSMALLPEESIIPHTTHKPDTRCLIISDSTQEDPELVANLLFVLDQMSVGCTQWDIIGNNWQFPPLNDYKTIIITFDDFTPLYGALQNIFDWVKRGGGLLLVVPSDDEVLSMYEYMNIGVKEGVYTYIPHIKATLETDFLAGGRGITMQWSNEEMLGIYRTGVNFRLDESSIVHMKSSGPEGSSPMLWEHRLGLGRVVVNNNDAFAERWSRGLVAAAYSLLEPAVAWPVINASLFFIDDFPSPIGEGYDEYIKKEFGVQNEHFFTHIWFPDMLRLANKYKIKYSSVFIETYNDNVTPPFEVQEDTERMKYFGSLFMEEGHEIGLHGYNHQSLAFENFDYKDELPYNKWQQKKDVVEALSETIRLYQKLFPGMKMKTYVPPSNVLTPEARAILKENFPDITVISSLLVDGIFELYDDFGIAKDGFINIPRIASGYFPLDIDEDEEQGLWIILNELNLHFINSHFIHPDDVMDPERGAGKGWKQLYKSFEEFVSWLDKFPLRKMTAQEAAAAVQRFDNLTVHTTLLDHSIILDLDGFIDEAYLLVRVNEGTPGEISGGSLTPVRGTLYLLKAENAHISINLEQS